MHSAVDIGHEIQVCATHIKLNNKIKDLEWHSQSSDLNLVMMLMVMLENPPVWLN